MPQANTLQSHQRGHPPELESQLDIQTPSSTLRQHLDPEAFPRPDYFDSLDDLHLWYQMKYGDALRDDLESCDLHTGPPEASSSRSSEPARSRPKLVVCHDFQGGYNEHPAHQGYSLEHLHLVDTFIYFSHKRVSIPPAGWLTAAARTGTKVLGTLIFEWSESIPDMARLLRGPERKAIPPRGTPCFSPQYAIELIELALERGFSGYLVNIEVGLDLGFSCSGEAWPAWVDQQTKIVEMHRNAERLRGWLHFLREEGTKRFVEAGKHADEWEVMWYDSVVYPHGQLAWQDALNEHNISFFQSAHTFFTNYTWARPPQPLPPGQLIDPNDDNPQILQLRGYGLTGPDDGGYHPQLLLSAAMADSVDRPRQDVYVGIDVFGRNCWGGLKAWKSFDMIRPQQDALGLSVALFAPGWTWEEESAGFALTPAQASQKRRWSDWWHIDSAFWLGISDHPISPPHRITIAANEVKPVQSYFSRSNLTRDRLCRRASRHGFYTNFSFGSGTRWFDGGKLVHDWAHASTSSENLDPTAGFTDMGACMPKPDLLYAEWQDMHRQAESPLSKLEAVSWTFDHKRAWSGTCSFVVSFTARNGAAEMQRVQIPLCSAVLTDRGEEWQYTVVYDAKEAVEIDPCVTLALGSGEDAVGAEVVLGEVTNEDLAEGWRSATVSFRLTHPDNAKCNDPIALSLGFSPRLQSTSSVPVRVGALQLSRASPSPRDTTSALEVRPASDVFDTPQQNGNTKHLQAAVLSWTPPRDSAPSAYFNVWVQQVAKPETRVWLSTSTREATPFEYCLPSHLVLPPHLADAGELEYVVTSLDVPRPVEIAKARAILL
ncbi:related to Endo-b-N-acetylglucosaminidase [Sporisorium reilianum f. sp. reilianum]|uniref:Related to Endo-b-N-acetylglucosaminidase n=1 Tax=Sporisorium reilianum f. sp. reilianum TaxID=72559 RepID=A0A2N8UAW4_9BASI|nr:related to Endo-b-N-acetylglucosaminidase [Sporisorium reilianum f. sp. reilianum]